MSHDETSNPAPAATDEPIRAWAPWSAEEDQRLIDQVRVGLDDHTIAEDLERTTHAVRARAFKALGDRGTSRSHAVQQLRTALTLDRQFPWRANLGPARSSIPVDALPVDAWSEDDDQFLRNSWTAGQPLLPRLARRFETSETAVVARILQLGDLAWTIEHVYARLGEAASEDAPQTLLQLLHEANVSVPAVNPWSRRGDPWELEDYELLVKALRAGVGYEGAALVCRRPASACRSRAKALIWRTGYRGHSSTTAEDAVQDEDFDWTAHVRRYHQHEDIPLWTGESRQIVQQAWETGDPGMAKLAKKLKISEEAIARHLIAAKVAPDLIAVAERLGFSADTHLARLVAWRNATSMYVLTAGGTPEAASHVSLHLDRHDARTQCQTIGARVWQITRVDSTNPLGGGEVIEQSDHVDDS